MTPATRLAKLESVMPRRRPGVPTNPLVHAHLIRRAAELGQGE